MSAFKRLANAYWSDALAMMRNAIERELDPSVPKYISKLEDTCVVRYEYEVMNDFVYEHLDQDVAYGTYRFKKGEIIDLKSGPEQAMYFMPDRSNLKLLRKFEDWYSFKTGESWQVDLPIEGES